MPKTIVLNILRSGQTIQVDLAEIGSPIYRGELQVDDAVITEFCTRHEQLLRQHSDAVPGQDSTGWQKRSTGSGSSLREIGEAIYSRMLPKSIGQRLRESEPALLYLHLDERLHEVPWEIAFDGVDFLSSKFSLGRQVFTNDLIRNVRSFDAPLSPCRLLLVTTATESLPAIDLGVEQLATRLSNVDFIELTSLRGQVKKSQLLAALNSQDIVHFVGRIHVDEEIPSKSGWQLDDGVLSGTDVKTLGKLPLLIFSQSIAIDDTTEVIQNGNGFGVSSGFLLAGVQNVVVGSLWRQDVPGLNFAASFYGALFRGMNSGEALIEARSEGSVLPEGNDVSWSTYSLYGDPAFAPFLGIRPNQDPEKRQLTVMFCDLVESTKLSGQLDPEDYRKLVRLFQQACAQVISEYQGYISQYLGDGILIYFGYPTAHEDSADRAVRSAMAVLQLLPRINAELEPLIAPSKLKMRIGIHTGPVIVGEMGADASGEFFAVGETLNVASRLQEHARANTVLISETTHHRIHDHFDCEELGQLDFGVSAPVNVFRVNAERRSQEATSTLTPFVGRQDELTFIQDCWGPASAGSGQIALISGEPGIGKTRLVREFNKKNTQPPHRQITCYCSPYHRNIAHFPLINTVRKLLNIKDADSTAIRLRKIEKAMSNYGFNLEEAVPLIASLLSVPFEDRYTSQQRSPERGRQRMQSILIDWLASEARIRPVRFLIEDVQWIDPSTLSMLSQLVDESPDYAMLILVTFRPGCRIPWGDREGLHRLHLDGLPRSAAEVMVRRVAGSHALAPPVVERLVTQTDGVPLFLEEYTLMALETDHQSHAVHNGGRLSVRAIPSSLQDLVMERLDRLDDAKEIAQLASTIGREFDFDLLKTLSPLSNSELRDSLAKLMDAGLVFEREAVSPNRYVFKHMSTCDAAYESLLKGRRQRIHKQIAEYLESQGSAETDESELLAHHYTEAGETDKAVAAWQVVGRRQARKSAYAEAINHLSRALDLLSLLPDSTDRTKRELEIQTSLASCMIATKGYGASQVESTYARALELCHSLDDQQRLLKVLMGLEGYHFMRGDFQMAHQFADQALVLLDESSNPERLSQIHWAIGEIFFHRGEFGLSRDHMEQSMGQYNAAHQKRGALQDPKIMCMCYSAWGLWELGYPQRALDTAYEVVEYANSLANPFGQAEAWNFAAAIHLFRREANEARRLAETSIELCSEHDYPVWLALAKVIRGRAQSELGQIEAGLSEMHEGIELWESTGALVTIPYYLALLAEGLAIAGRPEEGYEVICEALGIVDRTGERYYEAELHRLQGELYLQRKPENGGADEAELCFMRAIDVARRQGVLSLELRGVLSLARLAQKRQRGSESVEMLTDVIGRFTEGLDTQDLKDANLLLHHMT